MYGGASEAAMSDGFPYGISLTNGRVLTAGCVRDAASYANSASENYPSRLQSVTQPNARLVEVLDENADYRPSDIRPHDIVEFVKNRYLYRRTRHGRQQYQTNVLCYGYVVKKTSSTVRVRAIHSSRTRKRRQETIKEFLSRRGLDAARTCSSVDIDLDAPVVPYVVFQDPIELPHREVRMRKMRWM